MPSPHHPFLILITFLLYALAPSLQAQIRDTTDAFKYYNGYQEERRKGQVDQAFAYLKQATAYYERAQAWDRMISSYQEQISYMKAQGRFALPRSIRGQMNQKINLILQRSEAQLVEAEAFEKTGRLAESAKIYQEVLDLQSVLKGEDAHELAENQYHLGGLYYQLGMDIKALKYLLLGAKGLEEIGGEKLETSAKARLMCAELYERLDNIGAAAQQTEKALFVYRQKPEFAEKRAETLLLAARYHKQDGSIGTALEKFLLAFEATEAIKDKDGYVESALGIGNIYVLRGSYYLARSYYDKAKKFDQMGALLALGKLEIKLDHYEMAVPTLKKALSHAQNQTNRIAETKLALAKAQVALGRIDEAAGYVSEALQIAEDLQIAEGLLIKGDISFAKRDIGGASKQYNLAKLNLNRQGVEKGELMARILFRQYQALAAQGEHMQAIQALNASICANIPSCKQLGRYDKVNADQAYDLFLLFESLKERASVLKVAYASSKDKADLKAAFESYLGTDQAITLIRSSQDSEEDKLALAGLSDQFYDDAIETAYRLKEDRYAFYFSERNKAAILLETVSSINQQSFAGIPSDLIQEEKNLRAEVGAVKRKIAESYASEDQVKYYQDKLLIAERQHALLLKKFETQYPNYHSLKLKNTLPTIGDIQALIDPATWFVEYYTTKDKLYIFTITKSSFKLEVKPLDKKFFLYQKGMRNAIIHKVKDAYATFAAQLYLALIPKSIPEDVSKLIFVPDGYLSLIPFEALLSASVDPATTSYKDFPYLVKRFDVTYSSSAALLQVISRKKSTSVSQKVLITTPVFDFEIDEHESEHFGVEALPATVSETEEIKKRFALKGKPVDVIFGKEATENKFKQIDLTQYRYLHFATHGFTDSDSPEKSGLLLAPSTEGEDGVLYLDEIYALPLQNADLVVLSACEMGIGKLSRGEGIIGMTRAFIYAGAKNLQVSLWQVADQSTGLMLSDNWANILSLQSAQQSSGFDPQGYGSALRLSKLLLISQGTFAEPFYWSPFIVIGQ